MTKEEKEILLNLIKNGNVQTAIEKTLSLNLKNEWRHEALIISNRYQELKRKRRSGILSTQEETILNNQIVNDFLELIDFVHEQSNDEKKTAVSTERLKSEPKKLYFGYILIGIIGSIAFIGLFLYFFPSEKQTALQLTVFVTDTKGNPVLENEGRLNIPLGNRSLNEVIGANGRTNFADITKDNKGDSITIGLEAKGWELVEENTFIFTGKPIHLKVKKDNSLGTIQGVILSRDGQDFIAGAKIMINADTTILSDADGKFKVILPKHIWVKKHSEKYQLKISKEGYKTESKYYRPNDIDEIRLTPKEYDN